MSAMWNDSSIYYSLTCASYGKTWPSFLRPFLCWKLSKSFASKHNSLKKNANWIDVRVLDIIIEERDLLIRPEIHCWIVNDDIECVFSWLPCSLSALYCIVLFSLCFIFLEVASI